MEAKVDGSLDDRTQLSLYGAGISGLLYRDQLGRTGGAASDELTDILDARLCISDVSAVVCPDAVVGAAKDGAKRR